MFAREYVNKYNTEHTVTGLINQKAHIPVFFMKK